LQYLGALEELLTIDSFNNSTPSAVTGLSTDEKNDPAPSEAPFGSPVPAKRNEASFLVASLVIPVAAPST